MSATPRTDAASSQIWRIACRWKTGEIDIPEFGDQADAAMDDLRKLETELAERDAAVKDLADFKASLIPVIGCTS